MKKQQLDEYLEEANAWNDDRIKVARRSEIKAWNVATGACLITGLSIVCIMLLLPLKETRTEVLLADKSTGLIQPLQKLAEVQVNLDESFIKRDLTVFLLARESFSSDESVQEDNYYKAAAFMSPELQNEWGELWKRDNQSPYYPPKFYGPGGKAKVTINSIILNKRDEGSIAIATIRFTKEVKKGGMTAQPAYFIATIPFRWVNPATTEKERMINPAGFQITDYRVDPEIGGNPNVKGF